MANPQLQDYIHKYLPQDLWEKAAAFDIPVDYIQNMPDLVILLLNSRTISVDEEKQSWFSLLPVMNNEQLGRLREILDTEKKKFDELQKNYEDKKVDIKKKYLMKRNQVNQNIAIQKNKEEEKVAQSQDHAAAEDLLKWL